MKGKVERLIKEKDNVVRGVILRHKVHLMEHPLQAVCPLEICSDVDVVRELPAENVVADKAENTGRVKRRAAADVKVITHVSKRTEHLNRSGILHTVKVKFE